MREPSGTVNEFPVGWNQSPLISFSEIPLVENPFFRSIEVQAVRGEEDDGFVIVAHKAEGPIDVYYDRCLGLREGWTATDPAFSHLPVENEVPTVLEGASCDVGPSAVDARADFVDARGHEVRLSLRHGPLRNSGPTFVPNPRKYSPLQLRFLFMSHLYYFVDQQGSDVSVTVDGKPIPPQRLSPLLPPNRLSARSGGDLTLAGLCGPDLATVGHAAGGEIAVGDGQGTLICDLDSPAKNGRGDQQGTLRVRCSIGTVATGLWEMTEWEGGRRFELAQVKQDWRPPTVSVGKQALRLVRRFRRRDHDLRYVYEERGDSAGHRLCEAQWHRA